MSSKETISPSSSLSSDAEAPPDLPLSTQKREPRPQHDSSCRQVKQMKKRVRISEADPSTLDDDTQSTIVMTDQERSDSWWSATDFAEVKDSVKRQCRDHRQNQHYSDCLTDAYQSACILAAQSADDNGLVSEANESQFPDESTARRLTDEEAPRGLEVYSSRLHAMRRQRHLQESKHAVFLEQARQQSHNLRDADRLAQQASRASRWARSFAILLGNADAWAASRKQHPPPSAADGTSPTALDEEETDDQNPVTEESSSEEFTPFNR